MSRFPPSASASDRYDLDLLLGGGCLASAKIEELRADQPGEIGAVYGGDVRVLERSEIGADQHVDPVASDGG